MSIISEFKKQEDYCKPNPGQPNSDWFIPVRTKCHICKTFGRKPIYKSAYQLYYHYSYKHKTELESEWRFRVSQLLKEVGERK